MERLRAGPVDDPRYDPEDDTEEPLAGWPSVPRGAPVVPMPRYRPLPRPRCVARLIERRAEAG